MTKVRSDTQYVLWRVPPEQIGLRKQHNAVTTIAIESPHALKNIFVPGRRARPHQVQLYNRAMVSQAIWALQDIGWSFEPESTLGIPIMTEGAAVDFVEAFQDAWGPNITAGGRQVVWVGRNMTNGPGPSGTFAQFEAQVFRCDTIPPVIPRNNRTGIFFDIGASGSTLTRTIECLAPEYDRLIFASPCTSKQAAVRFAETAIFCGLKPENLAVVAFLGFFGLHVNSTYLSLRLNGAITSRGSLALSRLVYHDPSFCHIGSGGRRANYGLSYQQELHEDERQFGSLPEFRDLNDALQQAGVNWPDDFGSPLERK